MPEDRVNDCILKSSSLADDETAEKLHPYHKPTLVHYGGLADLIKTQPGVGSDGGAADCSHA